jgi:hypothetical protein
LFAALEARWPDLGSPETRRHAVVGAQTLRLVDADLAPTAEGRAVADLLRAVKFAPEADHSKRQRLFEVNAAIAAVARLVLLQQPAVRLILRTLAVAGGPLTAPQLLDLSYRADPTLAGALFLGDPSRALDQVPLLDGADYNPSTVYKLKQNLWHAGLLATKAHPFAGGKASRYEPSDDVWALEQATAGVL